MGWRRLIALSGATTALGGLALAAPLAGTRSPSPATVQPAAEGSVERAAVEDLIARAIAAIRRDDGVDAEMKLRAALQQGAERRAVNALMGEALLAQGDFNGARKWLKGRYFSSETAAAGWRVLGRLERLEGNLPIAGKAYDRALELTPRDASLWVEIGRLRYAGGEHRLAIEAAGRAVELDPGNVRALEFAAELVRDRYGPLAAIPWFERALVTDPKDISVLLGYAATLGDLGRAGDCLAVTRRVLELSPANPRAFYLQAVLAARGGKYEVARQLLIRTKGALDTEPGVLLLQGVVELAAGNSQAAIDALEAVLRLRPGNRPARDMLARAIMASGEPRYLVARFRAEVEAGTPSGVQSGKEDGAGAASTYLLTQLARASEVLGDRRQAGRLLDRAARNESDPQASARQVVTAGTERQSLPGSYEALVMAGDGRLASGDVVGAQARYAQAAQIRMPNDLFDRRLAAYGLAQDEAGARDLIEGVLQQNPGNRAVLRAAAQLSMAQGDMSRARSILQWLHDNGGSRDVHLLSLLATVDVFEGEYPAALAHAGAAYRLQRASPYATQALAFSYAFSKEKPRQARALLAKARMLVGPTPLIAQSLEELERNKAVS